VAFPFSRLRSKRKWLILLAHCRRRCFPHALSNTVAALARFHRSFSTGRFSQTDGAKICASKIAIFTSKAVCAAPQTLEKRLPHLCEQPAPQSRRGWKAIGRKFDLQLEGNCV